MYVVLFSVFFIYNSIMVDGLIEPGFFRCHLYNTTEMRLLNCNKVLLNFPPMFDIRPKTFVHVVYFLLVNGS